MNLSFDYLRTKIKEMYGDALADVNSNTISIIPEKCNYAIEKPEHLSVLWKQKKIRSDQLPCVSFSVKTSQRDFSTYNNLNGVLTMFNLPTVYSIDDLTQIDFPAEYASDEDEKLIQELFDEIKKRFKALGPLCHGVNEATRTEYISPFMINAVAGCPPGTVLRPQLRFVGSHDKGPVDYAIEYKSTLIRITETKVNELGKGLAQNVVQLQAAAQHNIRKRKRNSDDSDYDSDTIYGIVTTGVEWLVVLFALDSALIRVAATTHNILKIGVDDRSTSDEELRKQVRKVFLIIRTLLKEQIDFNSKKSPTEKKEALCKRIRVV
ncbi:9248_t:CDS:2 [Paraglomus occultum]|uniref:9248_t:CDS:1 n=1 Tax=Paraglomus occultum TaxID=144539 RepID=A0A9N8YYK2_9GLOM|nr:9248_t:CDS:2 [Paraglomus occultum]